MASRRNVGVVILAAGCGTRMGEDIGIAKQYVKVDGIPLICYCLRSLRDSNLVGRIVVVADDIQKMEKVSQEFTDIIIVKGERSRHLSILEGLKKMHEFSPDIVVVHDAVRPIIPKELLEKVIMGAEIHGAAGLVCPLVSTVVLPNESCLLDQSLDRSKYRNSEMPQAFRFKMILEAYERCPMDELVTGTEILSISLHYGNTRPILIEGSADLWKVTYPRDLQAAEYILPKYFRCIRIIQIPQSTEKEDIQEISSDSISLGLFLSQAIETFDIFRYRFADDTCLQIPSKSLKWISMISKTLNESFQSVTIQNSTASVDECLKIYVAESIVDLNFEKIVGVVVFLADDHFNLELMHDLVRNTDVTLVIIGSKSEEPHFVSLISCLVSRYGPDLRGQLLFV